MCVVLHNGKHYVGGSVSGCEFLRNQGSHTLYSFIGHLSAQYSMQLLVCITFIQSLCIIYKNKLQNHQNI